MIARLAAALCLLVPAVALAQQAVMNSITDPGFTWSRSWVDINNDGRDDYCMFIGGSAEYLDCWLSSTAGVGTSRVTYGIGAYPKGNPFHYVDINGDGRVDLCRYTYNGITCHLGQGFTSAVTVALPLFSHGYDVDGNYSMTPGVDDGKDIFLVDVDADGRADLCYAHRFEGIPARYDLRCLLSTGSGFAAPTAGWIRELDIGDRQWPRGFHEFNGDGFPDFCRLQAGGYLRCLLAGPGGFIDEVVSTVIVGPYYKEGAAFIDVNGDGKTDFCRFIGSAGAYRLSCRLSNGRSWETSERSSPVLAEGHPFARWWVDINGDGLPDFCRAIGADPGTGSSDVNSTLACRLSRAGDDLATGLFAVADVTIDANFGRGDGGRAFCDPWGAGISTFCRATFTETATGPEQCVEGYNQPVCYTPTAATHGIRVGLLDAMQARQPLLAAYSDGLGAETRVTYKPLTDWHVYARSGFGETPRVSIAIPRSLVVFESRAWRTGTNTTLTGNARYFYKDLRLDNQQGSRGFRERWLLTEGSNSLEHVVYYQGLGPGVDASSILNDPREIGQIKEQKRYSIDSASITPAAEPPGMNPRQALLAAIMSKASAPGGMPTAPSGLPTAANPFMLLQRTANTQGDTVPANPRFRLPVASRVESWDWNGRTPVVLPITDSTTVMSDLGNVSSLVQTTTHGSKVWKKTTNNAYQDDPSIWLLGRLTKARVVSEAPSVADQLATYPRSYGTSPNANTLSSGNPPAATLAPPAFPNTQVGQTSTATATLTNNSSAALAVVASSVSVSGADLAFESTTCSSSLAVGASCGITMRFTPTQATTRNGSVVVDTGAGPRTAPFAATSLATLSVATLTSAAPNFGVVWYGTAAPTAAVNFRNDGNASLTLSGLSGLPAFFEQTSNTCSSIAPGGSCSISIRMPTSAAGSASGTVTTVGATTNASFSVSGSVYSAVSRWSTTSLAFGDVRVGQSSTQSLTLYNDGFGAAINWSGALANLPAGFSANTSACSAVGSGGASCTVSVTFTPAAAQAYGGSTIYPSNISYYNNTLSISGNGLPPLTTLSGSPTSLGFGSISKDSFRDQTLTVTNTTSNAANGMNYAFTYSSGGVYNGFYSRVGGTCPAAGGSLAGGASCTVVVRYRSGCTGGSRNGALNTSGSNFTTLVTSLSASTSFSGICN